MKKMKKKRFIFILIVVVIMSGVVANAATKGSFSFKMHTSVKGKTQYTLAKKTTSVSATANTYNFATDKPMKAQSYMIALPKSTIVSGYTWKSMGPAKGTKKTVSFGTLSAGKYNVYTKVTNTQGNKQWYIKGTGTINQ